MLTVSVVVEVGKLVTPLRDDSKRIFEKGDNDEETANGWKISMRAKSAQCPFSSSIALFLGVFEAVAARLLCCNEAHWNPLRPLLRRKG